MNNAERNIILVSGYLHEDYPPEIAYDAGLRNRFSVVLQTYRSDKVDMFFDFDQYTALLTAIVEALPHDSEIAEYLDGAQDESVASMFSHLGSQSEYEREPPKWLTLKQGGETVGLMETEFWVRGGGPGPYHDSYTLSIYTAEDHTDRFRQICGEVCSQRDCAVADFHKGVENKRPRVPWWKRPYRWLQAYNAI